MDKQTMSLEDIPVSRHLLESLYNHHQITQSERDYLLDTLYPKKQWGLWVSRLLLSIGTTLILAGIIYFFAFNWAKIPAFIKLASIQILMIACLVGTCFSSKKTINKLLLLSASIIVGVFLAVFGQIYQTGANAYQLFLMWAILISGWTILSNFTPQWFLWIVIVNLFITLKISSISPTDINVLGLLLGCIIVLNTFFLLLYEYLVYRKTYDWLYTKWFRPILTTFILLMILTTTLTTIDSSFNELKNHPIMPLSCLIALVSYGLLFYLYRCRLTNIYTLVTIILTGCIILIRLSIFMLVPILPLSIRALVIGIIILAIFSFAVEYLKNTTKKWK